MKRANLIISGNVQGVGYRSWAVSKARESHLTGWVKNRSDGSVEIVAEGERDEIENFIDICWEGPEAAWVEDIKISWGEASNTARDFSIIH